MYGLETIKAEKACSSPLNAEALLVKSPSYNMAVCVYVNVNNENYVIY